MLTKNIFAALAIFILISGFTSCAIQKRHYMPGFYVGSKSDAAVADKRTSPTVQKQSRQIQLNDLVREQLIIPKKVAEVEVTSSSGSASVFDLHSPKEIRTYEAQLGCDTIFFKDGSIVAARVVEIGPRSIKYRYCAGPDQEIRSVQKAAVSQITFANGLVEKFGSASNSVSSPSMQQERELNKYALAGFVLSLVYAPVLVVGLVIVWISGFGAGMGILAIGGLVWLAALILSVTGIIQISKDKTHYRGMVLAVLGAIFTGLPLLIYLKSLLRI